MWRALCSVLTALLTQRCLCNTGESSLLASRVSTIPKLPCPSVLFFKWLQIPAVGDGCHMIATFRTVSHLSIRSMDFAVAS